jgi:hypothetical protein
MKLGCCIISAGKLRNLRTNQYDWNKFHVVDGNGFIISKGVIGDDRIFYLLDNNLLKRHSAQGSGQPDVSVGIEEHQSRRIGTLQGVDVNRSLYVNRTIDFSNAEATTHNDDDTDTENRERDDFEEVNDLHVLSDHNPTISMVTKGNDVVMEPDLSDSKLQMKHRKHTKYKYSNQPIRFRNANDNIMNHLHLRFGPDD